ncbi:MAG: SDR family NAD(P)-dependent oxidoreductase [Mycobacteriaceae bacterium]
MSKLARFTFAGRRAVLTGAAGGIGEQVAYGLAKRGMHLTLLDRDAERLDKVATAIANNHPRLRVDTHVVDLADRDATTAVARELAAAHPRLDLLINNAGVALGGRFEQLTLEEFEWLMDINFRAPVTLTHHLLPSLIASPGSHLVNVSSVFGIIGPVGQSAYSSSKFALRGLSEVLRSELAPRNVGVTSVHPGGIRTRVALDARIGAHMDPAEIDEMQRDFQALLTISPQTAANALLAGIEQRKPRVLIGLTAHGPDLLARLMPGTYGRPLALTLRTLTRLKGTATPHTDAAPSGA